MPLSLLAALVLAASVARAEVPAKPAQGPAPADWAALAKLPDWSGVWVPDIQDQVRQVRGNPAPWTPEAGRRIAFLQAEEAAGRPRGLFTDCLPEGMPSWMLISHNAMEVLFTPGRVTMLGESDGNRLRRIYTDGRGHPSGSGSQLPWRFRWPLGGRHPDGRHRRDPARRRCWPWARRWACPTTATCMSLSASTLIAPDVLLADDLTIAAPHVLTAPWKTTRLFRRQHGPGGDIVEGVCRQGDFTEAKDKDGAAVFVPLRQKDGNALPDAP